MSALARAREHYRRQRAIVAAGVLAARRQIKIDPRNPVALTATVGRYQFAAAAMASRTMATEAGRQPYVDPIGFVGTNNAGLPLLDVMGPLLGDLERQVDTLQADMLARIDRVVASEITDAGRGAESVEIVLEPDWTNYVRVLNPPSCSRCAILAGRIYRDNEGFLRHPMCDCVHWPVGSWEEAHDEGLVFSARDAFEKGQITGLSAADAQAIADGADIASVVNAAQGLTTTSIFGRGGLKVTTAGTTKRSAWRKANPNRPVRLRPESIYELADGDKAEEQRLLKLYGYVRADADVPAGTGAGGSNGGGRPPAPPDRDDGEEHPLEPHEAEFKAKMEALGHEVRRLPLGAMRPDGRGRLPSNDFAWVNNDGIHFELKSKIGTTGKLTYRKIRTTIYETVVAAAEHGFTKDNFIVDIGEKALREVLKAQLSEYNRRRDGDEGRIERLWVMTRGELVEIPLK